MAITAYGNVNVFRAFGSMRKALDVYRNTILVLPVEVIFNAVMVLYALMRRRIRITLFANVQSIIDTTQQLINANISTIADVLMASNGINTTINANQITIAIEAVLRTMAKIMLSSKIVN